MQDRRHNAVESTAAEASSLIPHPSSLPNAPIGVFDSGVGGLTVVGALLRRFPNERVLYVADQAHVPYGGRPLEEVRGFAIGISRFLADQGCKAIVMACNISSAVALPCVRKCLAPLPVLGMIEPAVRGAAASESPRIGVLATEGTVRSGAYSAQLRAMDPTVSVLEVPCPDFVPLVEAGDLESFAAFEASRRYLMPLAEAACTTIILGCTHYPFLLPMLRRAADSLDLSPVEFIDPADEVAGVFEQVASLNPEPAAGENVLLTTGGPDGFRGQVPRFLSDAGFRVGAASWNRAILSMC